MQTSTLLSGLVALAIATLGEAKGSTTKTTTRTIFLPSRATGTATNIYASIIAESSSTTEFLLACQTAFSSPYNCDGDFKGVTLTYGASVMDINFGATEYDCDYGSTAVCTSKSTASGPESTITMKAEELAARMTAITILDTGKKKTTKKNTKAAQTTAQSGSGLCKRKTTHADDSSDTDSSGSSNSGTSKSGSGSGDSSSSSDSSDKKKKKGDGCSEGSLASPGGSVLLFLSIFSTVMALL